MQLILSLVGQLVCLCRDFHAVPALAKTHLVDSLCSSLSLLNASASALLEAPGDSETNRDTLSEQHYSALKAYVFFLHWTASQAEQEQRTAAKSAPAAAGSRGRTKGKKPAQISSSWDWDADREKLAKAFAGISQIDLWRLCSPNNPEEAFLLLWSQTVSSSLDKLILGLQMQHALIQHMSLLKPPMSDPPSCLQALLHCCRLCC